MCGKRNQSHLLEPSPSSPREKIEWGCAPMMWDDNLCSFAKHSISANFVEVSGWKMQLL